jgi:hypothetical protein
MVAFGKERDGIHVPAFELFLELLLVELFTDAGDLF